MSSHSEALVERLLDPKSYEIGKVTTVELRQTHISWVFLTDLHAFKMKKPVVFGDILDFSTRDKRLRVCKEELRLNQRMAPDYYLGLAWVNEEGHVVIDDETPSVNAEPLVMMKRFDERYLLRNLLANKDPVPRSQMIRLAQLLAEMHEQAAERPEYGDLRTIRYKWEENFDTTSQLMPINLRFKEDILRFIDEHQGLFESRLSNHRVRENHGDVQSNNIVLPPGNADPIVFDALEFNELLRCGDVAEEIGFLTMDMKSRSRYDLSALVLEHYVEASGDEQLLDLIPFYEAYRAFVRGKVAAFGASNEENQDQREKLEHEARRYLQLAEECFYGTTRGD